MVPFFGPDIVDEIEQDDDYEACVEADPALLEEIAEVPEDHYVNLHNARYPGGVIRGQLAED